MGGIVGHPTFVDGLVVVEGTVHSDHRGRFRRAFCSSSMALAGNEFKVAQANFSETVGRGTIRGLHYQRSPDAETKLVSCVKGRVFDVVVDLRAGSETFLRWYGVELSGDSARSLLIPRGCAHGFQVLDEAAEMLYFHDTAWVQASEGGLRHDDPAIGIAWPLPAMNLSARDLAHPLIDQSFGGLSP